MKYTSLLQAILTISQLKLAHMDGFLACFFQGAVGLIVAGPIGLAGGLAVGGSMAYEFEKHIWKKILDVVKRESKVQPTLDSIEHIIHIHN